MLAFNRTDLERLFPSTTWQRAESLREQSAVVEINVERDGRSITGRVRGERRTAAADGSACPAPALAWSTASASTPRRR
jgi:hypothetical protein